MRKKLYGNTVQPSCEHCAHGRKSFDGNAVLCDRKGVMPLYHHCRKFRYDPLKRIPFLRRMFGKLYGRGFPYRMRIGGEAKWWFCLSP